MKSLFLRIFLSFWITMGLIVVAYSTVTAFVWWQRFDAFQKYEMGDIAVVVNQHLQTEGIEGMRRWLQYTQDNDKAGIRTYIVDMYGNDIIGQPISERIERRIRRMASMGYLADAAGHPPPLMPDPLGTSPQLIGADGNVYTFFADAKRNRFQQQQFELSWSNLASLAVAMSVSAIACWLLARSVSRPVGMLQDNARSLATGNLQSRVDPEISNRRDELGGLAREFDQMADRLRNLLASKESLMRNVSHELRSPLARLRVALSLARREGADQPKEFERMERETERLDALIGQILRFSRLDDNDPNLKRQPVDLTQLLAEVVEDARLEGRAKDKSVLWEQPTTHVTVMGVQDGLRSAIDNIMRNALRFTSEHSSVDVALLIESNKAVVQVRDHGRGVPQPDLERIFEPFYRVESNERDNTGSGLGLAIAARVASLHGGNINARNASDGGLIVEITLPLVS
jgi:two-component system, OmpR family, sensor kinase